MDYVKKYDIKFTTDETSFSFNIKERKNNKSFGSISIHEHSHITHSPHIISKNLKKIMTRNDLYVSDFEIEQKEKYKGKKIGKYLFCFAIHLLAFGNKSSNYEKIYLYPTVTDNEKRNTKLINYYKKHLGFEEVKGKDYLVALVKNIKIACESLK